MNDNESDEHVEERYCECCGKLIEEGNGSSLCNYCRANYPYCNHS